MHEVVVDIPFNKVFKEANRTRRRYRVLKGSAGSGKSVNVAQDFILKLSDPRFKGANLLCIRKIDVTNRNSTFAELKAAINQVFGKYAARYWHINESNMIMKSLVTGNEVIFRGVQHDRDREKLKSINFAHGKLTWIWGEEATELLEADLDILDDRLRGILGNPNLYYQITLTLNPVSATHWIKRKFFDVKDDDIFTHHSTYRDNRFIDDAYYRRMERRKKEDPEGYKVYGDGEWGELGGQIITNFVMEEFDTNHESFDAVALGQDFGFNHANALLELAIKDGELYALRELYVHDMDTGDIIKLANNQGWDKRLHMACDSAEPDRIMTWRRAGYNAYGVAKPAGSVNAQIDWLKQRKIHIHPNCQNLYKELSQWKWKKDNRTGTYIDEPVNFFDDAIAALRYGTNAWRLEELKVDRENQGKRPKRGRPKGRR